MIKLYILINESKPFTKEGNSMKVKVFFSISKGNRIVEKAISVPKDQKFISNFIKLLKGYGWAVHIVRMVS
jgi:hypothetical protein